MNSRFILIFFLFVLSLTPFSEIKADSHDDKIVEFYDKYAAHPLLGPYLMRNYVLAVKTGLDKDIQLTLEKNKIAQDLEPKIDKLLEDIVNQNRVLNKRTMAEARIEEPSQYPWVKQMVQKIMRKLHFPQRVVEDAKAFVNSSEDFNAYTYNALPHRFYDVVFNHGILKIGEGPLAAVIAHESGHQLGRHAKLSVTLAIVFQTAGINLIPPENPAKSAILDAAVSDLVENFVMTYMGFETAATAKQGAVARQIQEGVRRLAESVVNDYSADQVHEFYSAPAIALGLDMPPTPAEAAKKPGLKETMEFQQELKGRVSRAFETTADRISRLVSSREDCMKADAILAGGEGANIEAMKKQEEELQEMLIANPELAAFMKETQGHPSTVERAVQYEEFEHHAGFRRNTNPFLMMLADYLDASRLITAFDQETNRDHYELVTGKQISFKRADYIKFVKEANPILVAAVVEEFKAEKSDFSRFQALGKAVKKNMGIEIDISKEVVEAWKTEMGTPGRLLRDVVDALNTLKASNVNKGEMIDSAVKILQGINPRNLNEVTGLSDFITKYGNCAVPVGKVRTSTRLPFKP